MYVYIQSVNTFIHLSSSPFTILLKHFVSYAEKKIAFIAELTTNLLKVKYMVEIDVYNVLKFKKNVNLKLLIDKIQD